MSLEYWITRWSLSSGAHSRDPVAGDDEKWMSPALSDNTHLRIPAAHHARVMPEFSALFRGRGECRVLDAPAAARVM
jgi:hypothetical protein